ncbi:polysaccharide deacetylase family protein [Geomobilimonas luticola]|uniref:Polysaccharide deacetylase family protein n=1 Tax=Geomobilimonas luticola TaxID=1114878 RepID=A0ABS5SC20_9BACT|nr:polysaccharide deacetylase family protein [Geomobilimonas luticola]MBT0652930.1 polysaccharide deacetylase family protein [Geomobilimonas luticola]
MTLFPKLERSLTLFRRIVPATQLLSVGTILVYHGVCKAGLSSDLLPDSVLVEDFDRQMCYLHDNDYNVVSLQNLVSCLGAGKVIPENTVAITFDDGYRDTYTNAYPILQKYDLPATVFITAAFIGSEAPFPWLTSSRGNSFDARYPMTWNEVVQLHVAGMEIGSHTYTHQFLPVLSREQIDKELKLSRQVIAEKTGVEVHSLALPYSYPLSHRRWPTFKEHLMTALVQNSYHYCCTMLRGHIVATDNPFLLSRIPVGKYDDMELFKAKLSGWYAWTRFPQYFFQRYLKTYQ